MTFYLDENLSEYVADALNSLNKGCFEHVKVYSTITSFNKSATDEVIIPGIGKVQGILITRDLNIYRTQLQNELCKEHKLGVFFLSIPKGQNKHWDIVKLLVNRWEEIIEKSSKSRFPFAYKVGPRGKIKKLD